MASAERVSHTFVALFQCGRRQKITLFVKMGWLCIKRGNSCFKIGQAYNRLNKFSKLLSINLLLFNDLQQNPCPQALGILFANP